MKKIHLNSKRNTAFVKDLIKFIENKDLENFNFIEELNASESSTSECKYKSPISRLSGENNNVKQFCELYSNKLKIPHISINSMRNEIYLFSDQVKGNVDILKVSET